ncbi:aminotransferase class I/II-fold pyridoxal phosphate-dependent enzyme [Nonomuraea sp. NPDC052129]|uniref:aminotransferase class I/II-fold pyridoxal phosphate-dependent enzyme n=1 Tax=Nonomuraea sp. NPDC052129 TaxID=3154651 RepID=UPI00342EA486
MRELARTLQAQGRDVVNLTAGELSMPTPRHIVDAAIAAAQDPSRHGYGNAAGDPELRDAISGWAARSLGIRADRAQVAVTNGAKQALHNALRSLAGPGDEVIVPAPYWVTFPEAIRLAGATPVFAYPREGHVLTGAADLDAVRTPATRAVIICSPHNPTGAVHDDTELQQIVRWAAGHRIWVISDDTYRDLRFADIRPTPRAALDAGCDVVSIGSTSKSHAMTGWRTGWLIAPPEITATAIAIQSHTSSNVSRVAQAAALAALTGPDVATETRRELRCLRDELMGVFSAAGISFPAPEGAFYLFPPTSAHGGLDDTELAGRLLEDSGVAVVPGAAFGAPGHVRVSYAGAPETVTDGVRRLAAALGAGR